MRLKYLYFSLFISLLFTQMIFVINTNSTQSFYNSVETNYKTDLYSSKDFVTFTTDTYMNDKSSKRFLPNTTSKNWTYMVYLDGDNDLEQYAIQDIYEMEKSGGSGDNLNLIVLIDRIAGYDSSNGDWTDARILEITDDETNFIDSTLLVDLGEVEMDNPTTLRNFIEYCFSNYPAEYYCLTLWDHGNGIFGTCYDDTTSSTAKLTINEIQTAISTATDNFNETIDVLAFDCCEMGMIEIAYEFRNSCNYFIASEGVIPFDGFHYEKIVYNLNTDFSITPSDLCHIIVESFKDLYAKTSLSCLSALNISQIEFIVPIVSEFVNCIQSLITNKNCEYLYYVARMAAQTFVEESAVDFLQFLDRIKYYIPTSDLTIITSELILALEDIIIANFQQTTYYNKANGLSIFLPAQNYYISIETIEAYISISDNFQNIDWMNDTLWDEFILFLLNTFNLEDPDVPELLTLKTNNNNVMISEDYFKEYYVYLPKSGVYEFNCLLLFGDVDFRLAIKEDNLYTFIAKSSLINPTDDTAEKCRMYFQSGIYYLFIQGIASSSSYLLNLVSYTIPGIEPDVEYSIFGGSVYGEENGHFKQDLRHYYLMDLRKGSYLIQLNNSEDTSYQISIYDEGWNLLKKKTPSGLLNDLTIELNITDSSVYYIEIYCLFDYGECTLKVENIGNQNLGLNFIIQSFFLLIIFSISLYRKRINT